MKIGLVCPYNITLGGGVKEHVLAVKTELENRGYTVKVITPEPRSANGKTAVHEENGIIFMGGGAEFRSPLHTSAQISASIDPEAIDAVLAHEKFDILHFHEPWVPMLSRQVLSRSKAVNVATFHAKMPENVMSRTFTKVVAPYTKSILKYLHEMTAVSEAAADYIRELTDRPVTIIPNGINLDHFTKKPAALKAEKDFKDSKSSQGQTILYVGRLERRKGVNYLIKAFQLLQEKNEDISLVLAGDGPDREKLEEMVHDLGLRNVHFLGFVSEDEKIRLLHSADLFCAPAIYGESFGIVLLEAMASGLVTVAANNPGYSSVMQGLGALSLVNPRDTVEFARRLDLLLREDSLRTMWQNWAKVYVKQFSYKRIVDQYEGLYQRTYAEHAAQRRRRFFPPVVRRTRTMTK